MTREDFVKWMDKVANRYRNYKNDKGSAIGWDSECDSLYPGLRDLIQKDMDFWARLQQNELEHAKKWWRIDPEYMKTIDPEEKYR